MRECLFLIPLMMITAHGKAQVFHENFTSIEVIECPFQSDTIVWWPEGWSVYHTKSNLWDGEIDSAWCISLHLVISADPEYYMYIPAEEIDGERPVFIRTWNHPQLPLPLPPNMLFSISGLAYLENSILGLGTGNPPASGLIFAIDIPAEDGIARDRRNNFYEFQDTFWAYTESCFASEKFADQYVEDIVFALSLKHTKVKGYIAELEYIHLHPVYSFDILTGHEIEMQWWEDTSYVVPIAALGSMPFYDNNFILPYLSAEYPSSQHISYYDISPVVATDTAVTISLLIEEFISLVPQPFTAMRGGLVEGSDTLRHRVELINHGGNLCIEAIELNFEDDTKYIHKGGTIDLDSDAACMMFKAGATMKIEDKAHLDYGNPGKGFLAMKEGSQLILNKDASMTIHNTLVLQLSPIANQMQPTVYLYPGSRLAFSELAHLEAWGSADLRLQIVMLGGTLDQDALDANERALIEIIYPASTHPKESQELIVVQDPPNQIRVYFNADRVEQGTIYIVDLMGRVLYVSRCDIRPGNYYFTINTGALMPGWYGVVAKTSERHLAASFIR